MPATIRALGVNAWSSSPRINWTIGAPDADKAAFHGFFDASESCRLITDQ
jgi:hypothetical protein